MIAVARQQTASISADWAGCSAERRWGTVELVLIQQKQNVGAAKIRIRVASCTRTEAILVATTPRSIRHKPRVPASARDWADPSRPALLLLRVVFTVAPIAFGLDKFANLLTHWPDYLAPWVNDLVPGTGQQAMYAVGVVEVLAGIAVALRPRFGALVVAAWLAGIIVNLLSLPGYYDVALRDFGLLVAAPALWRLASEPAAKSAPVATTSDGSRSGAGAGRG
jgi:uncharacterized membrane protein YphA (DoxX/SURF4 family)